jgi:2-aminobenzoate-CoA ligase
LLSEKVIASIMEIDLAASAYEDNFARGSLPPRALWPRREGDALSERYPTHVNAATEVLDLALDRGFGAYPSVCAPGVSWSYAELIDKSNRIAEALTRQLGLKTGGRVLLRGVNSPMLAACWFGVLKAGGIAVTTMPLLRGRELSDILEKARIEIALCEASLLADLQVAQTHAPILRTVCAFLTEAPEGLEAHMVRASGRFETFLPSRDDVALIAFTSGTTGKPKATLHFHRDVLAIVDTVGEHVTRFSPGDVVAGSAPLGFTYGLGSLLLFPIRRGACSVLLPRVSAALLRDTIRDFGVTALMIGPTLYRSLLPLISREDVAGVRLCCSSGEALPGGVFEAWRDKTGLSLRNLLGSTEMLHAFIAADEENPLPGSLGRPLPGYEIEVFDEAMGPVAPLAVGRLAVRGPTGCRYLNDLQQQRKYVVDGWNLTGDSAWRDEHGVFWHHARTDEIIVSSGYNISGIEIENVLLEHPEVGACAVVGAPDEARGAIPVAFVVPARSEHAGPRLAVLLQDYVKRELAPYKYPRAVRFIDSLPLTETGKISRAKLRQMLVEP